MVPCIVQSMVLTTKHKYRHSPSSEQPKTMVKSNYLEAVENCVEVAPALGEEELSQPLLRTYCVCSSMSAVGRRWGTWDIRLFTRLHADGSCKTANTLCHYPHSKWHCQTKCYSDFSPLSTNTCIFTSILFHDRTTHSKPYYKPS